MNRHRREFAVAFFACSLLAAAPSWVQAAAIPSPAPSGVSVPLSTQPVPAVENRVSARYGFVAHGAYISVAYHLDALTDPQVFVQDPRVPAGVGLQNIRHAASFRPALFADDPASSLANAEGDPLGHDLATWLAARGALALFPTGEGERVTATFQSLIPGGHYSLFENIYPASGPLKAVPIDGKGTADNFIAGNDGRATIVVVANAPLMQDNAVTLIYHSDGQYQGMVRGEMGITAHVQLIVRIP